MKSIFLIFLKGIYVNILRILFASDRVTSKDIRNSILQGKVKYPQVVNDESCIGCGGCANICPVEAIEMVPLEKPVEIVKGYTKTQTPKYDPLKCLNCFWCHDNCPIYAFYGKPGAIHPREVGEFKADPSKLLKEPIKLNANKIKEIVDIMAKDSSKYFEEV